MTPGPLIGRVLGDGAEAEDQSALVAPSTAYRLLLSSEDSWVKKYDRSSLRTLGSGSELQACVWLEPQLWMLVLATKSRHVCA